MSSWLSPYSSEYSIDMCAAGSLPGFRTGTNGSRMRSAIAAPNRNPRDSIPTIAEASRRAACTHSSLTL